MKHYIIFFMALFLMSCSAQVQTTDTTPENTAETSGDVEAIPPHCHEGDSGRDYFEKGNAFGGYYEEDTLDYKEFDEDEKCFVRPSPESQTIHYVEKCTADELCYVEEIYCGEKEGPPLYDWDYRCEHGCSDGACLREPEQKEPELVEKVEEKSVEQEEEKEEDQEKPELKEKETTQEETVPPESIAIFYRTALSEVASRLPASVYSTVDGSGYTTNIRWESSEQGVVRYIPSIDNFEVMGTTTSTSYSRGSITPLTIGDRLFLIRMRSTGGTLTEVDPKTAQVTTTIPIPDKNIAVVGDSVYYRENIRTDLFDKRTGGGELMKHSFDEVSPEEVLSYGDPDNAGALYGAANTLYTVVHDYETQSDTIRVHSANGRVTKTLLSDVLTGTYIPASDGLYHVAGNDKVFQINFFPPSGEPTAIVEIELNDEEKGIAVDVYDGIILLVSYGADFSVKEVNQYSIEDQELTAVQFESFGSNTINYEFMILE